MDLSLDDSSFLVPVLAEPATLLAGKIETVYPEVSEYTHLPVHRRQQHRVLPVRVSPVTELHYLVTLGRYPVTVLVDTGDVDVIVTLRYNQAPQVLCIAPVEVLYPRLIVHLELVEVPRVTM